MKNTMKILLVAVAGFIFASCSSVRPYAVTNNSIGDEVGVSKTTLIFGYSEGDLLSSGISTNKNFGVIEAAQNGDIGKIGCVDVKTTSYLGIITNVEIIVSGTSKNVD